MSVENILGLADEAHTSGRLDEASRLARQALQLQPKETRALLLIGIVAVKRDDQSTAFSVLTEAMEEDAQGMEAPFWLSIALRKEGRMNEALDMAKRAIERNPDSADAQNQLGICCLDLKRFDEAVHSFGQACRIAPEVGPLFENLGRALQGLGRNLEAIDAYRRAVEIGPARISSLFRLGDAYMSEPQVDAAADCAKAILQMNPNSVPGNLLLARALIGAGKVEEGAKVAQKVIRLSPGNAVPVAYYGRALQSLGRIAEADEQFRLSIELEPRQGFAYYALVHNHKVTEEERALVDQMLTLRLDPGLPPRETIQLEYGLGKALEDLGEFGKAMTHLDNANQIDTTLKVGVPPFQKRELEETAKFLQETFIRSFFEENHSVATDEQLPIFVVGMMRSGTTLAEQILSSHSEVGGAGEQLFWPENAGSSHKLFDLSQGELNGPKLKSLAASYIELLKRVSPGKTHVVDKMNTNYLLLGLLHIAFPNARIIHMRRHPVDTCLSIWATPVANGINLCASKENIVFAYQQYVSVMEHWQEVLPADRLLTIQYEDLVSNQEKVTREMIAFCGLEWSDACLQPERNQRAVKTPSVWQVRQPVYKTSIQRWRKYEPFLGEFAQLLTDEDRSHSTCGRVSLL